MFHILFLYLNVIVVNFKPSWFVKMSYVLPKTDKIKFKFKVELH